MAKMYMKAIAGIVELAMPALLNTIPRRSEKNKTTLDYHEMRLTNIEEIQLKQAELNENMLLALKRKQRSINVLFILVILLAAAFVIALFVD